MPYKNFTQAQNNFNEFPRYLLFCPLDYGLGSDFTLDEIGILTLNFSNINGNTNSSAYKFDNKYQDFYLSNMPLAATITNLD